MAPVTYDAALEAVRERLTPRSVEHCERVADTAARLAIEHGVDTDDARLAGLLHDWDRDSGDAHLLAHADEAGIEITPVDAAVPYLLHARTGALALAVRFPELSERVLHAVASHTVGAGEMGDLDRVVYIADMIEPARDFPGVDELRSLATGDTSLAALYARCYQHTLQHLIERKRPLHPHTVSAWNALVAEGVR